MAICAYICVSKIGVYVDAGKGTALPVLVCVRGDVSIKCVCVSVSCCWPDLQMGRPAAALIGLGWEKPPGSESTQRLALVG